MVLNPPPWLGGRGRDCTLSELVALQTRELLPTSATASVDTASRTFCCAPTLTDSQVLDFCRTGVIVLPGVVAGHINELACEYLEGSLPSQPTQVPTGMTLADLERMRGTGEPSGILLEDWFINGVLLQPTLAGILRSLLGKDVGLPVCTSHHGRQPTWPTGQTMMPQGGVTQPVGPAQGWHQDADCLFGPELNYLEVFYFPQDTPITAGPTEVVPGTHIGRASDEDRSRDTVEGSVMCNGPAGTLAIHHQSILHRRAAVSTAQPRHMLKHNYFRTQPPTRDWLIESQFDLQTAYYGGHNVARFVAQNLFWLWGKEDDYRIIGGQGWPFSIENQIGPSWGYPGLGKQVGHEGVGSQYPSNRGYTPDWRRESDSRGYYYVPRL